MQVGEYSTKEAVSGGVTRHRTTLRLLGPVTLSIDGRQKCLPTSRKVRALLVFLAISRRPVTRGRLCELFWSRPGDPRGELRWTLSKLRAVFRSDSRQRIHTCDDHVWFDATDLVIDAHEVQDLSRAGLQALDTSGLLAVLARIGGDLAEGLRLDCEPQFVAWLAAQRRSLRAVHLDVIRTLAGRFEHGESDAAAHLDCIEKWLALARFDVQAHSSLMHALQWRGRLDECAEHFAATLRLFESEGIDTAGIRAAWHGVRAGARPRPVITPPDRSAHATATRH